MQEVIVSNTDANVVLESKIPEGTPIFAKKYGKFVGLVVLEDTGWITRSGGNRGLTGHSNTREECMRKSIKYGFEYFIES